MADLPIPFIPPMVKGLIREIEQPGAGKTQTRRILGRLRRFGDVTQFGRSDTPGYDWHFRDKDGRFHDLRHAELLAYLPYAVGDRLYVREAWRVSKRWDETKPSDLPPRRMSVYFDAGGFICNVETPNDWRPTARGNAPTWAGKARPAMFMPRWASRITLTVTAVRVEQLQDISKDDAIAEGITRFGRFYGLEDDDWDDAVLDPREAYGALWNRLNSARGYDWYANPWGVAYSFKPELINIDTRSD